MERVFAYRSEVRDREENKVTSRRETGAPNRDTGRSSRGLQAKPTCVPVDST